MKHTITVTTDAFKHESGAACHIWRDEMRWAGVAGHTLDWFANSCKAALSWYVNYPEVSGESYYTVRYSTVILDEAGNECAGTVRGAELARLDYAGLVSFQRFALAQLEELLQHFECHHGKESLPSRPRSKLRALASLLWSAVRA